MVFPLLSKYAVPLLENFPAAVSGSQFFIESKNLNVENLFRNSYQEISYFSMAELS